MYSIHIMCYYIYVRGAFHSENLVHFAKKSTKNPLKSKESLKNPQIP